LNPSPVTAPKAAPGLSALKNTVVNALRNLVFAVFLNALISVGGPLLQTSLYLTRLESQPAPGHLATPVAGVRTATLRDTWHAYRTGGRRHEGIDIFAPRGTPVLAATEGIVLRTGNNKLGGKVVWVLGPGHQRHYYAHLDRYASVYAGQRVQAGTILGYVGNTGNARGTPPHLHYGIYTRAGPINPFPLLVKRRALQ
jgi:murein DD-endopeptidase MepM/ murein hydrolase activator NlpD